MVNQKLNNSKANSLSENNRSLNQTNDHGFDLAPKVADRFLRKKEVVGITGLSASTIYRKESEGLFPNRLNISSGRIAWRLTEVNRWMQQQVSAQP